MALWIQKFGGSSVGSIERIQHVAQLIMRARDQGHQVAVVVSAMEGETDRLITLAQAITKIPNTREYDALISTGEQVSATLLSMTLIAAGCAARSYNGIQAGILTDSHHQRANILGINTQLLRSDLEAGCIPIITGFQGVDANGYITTLGRGGSDMSAVALAAALKADECQIFTDVDGIYTSDPRVVKKARMLSKITFDEMLELSSLGAKVLQIRSVELANKHNVPIRVLSSFNEGPGTLVTNEGRNPAQPVVSGIAFERNQAKFTILDLPLRNHSELIAESLRSASIDLDMMVQNIHTEDELVDFSFTVHSNDFHKAFAIAKQSANHLLAREIISNDSITKLSVVGLGMKSHAQVASKVFQTLEEERIRIHLITATETKISTVIDEKYTELGARALHTAFGLDVDIDPYQTLVETRLA